MYIMILLILISLLVACGFLFAYLWAARAGQFDDDYTPAVRMLFDDAPSTSQNTESTTSATEHATSK